MSDRYVRAVFFDLQKAYDTAWKHGILIDLHEAGFRGQLPLYLKILERQGIQGKVWSDFLVAETSMCWNNTGINFECDFICFENLLNIGCYSSRCLCINVR